MKRFHELNKSEQEQAIKFAEVKLQESIGLGLISTDKPLSQSHIREFASAAAEDAWYASPSDMVVADIAQE